MFVVNPGPFGGSSLRGYGKRAARRLEVRISRAGARRRLDLPRKRIARTSKPTLVSGTTQLPLTGEASGTLGFQSDIRWIESAEEIVYGQAESASGTDPQLMVGVVRRALSYFEPGAWPTWEPVEDPDSPGDHRIFLVVHTRLGPKEALAALDRFDQEWWLDQPSSFQSGLEVTVRPEE